MRDTITFSLPKAMTRQIEQACRREHRTKSELIREALRLYFGTTRGLPIYAPTKAELARIEKGREEIRRGHYYTLDELHASLAGAHRKPRAKKPRQDGRTRARTSVTSDR